MAWTIVAGTFCIVTLLLAFLYVGHFIGAVGQTYSFAPDAGAVLIDSKTDDGSYIVPLGQRPHYADRCSKRVRANVYTGFCW